MTSKSRNIEEKSLPETVRKAIDPDRLASAYLLYGRNPETFSGTMNELLQSMVCSEGSEALQACGRCRDCRMAQNLTHPDITAPGAPGDSSDHDENDRFRVQAVRDLIVQPSSLTPARSPYKLFWLHDLSRFTTEASNSLLKVLEEPPGEAVFFLTTRSRWDCLPTIRSRCHWIRIPPSQSTHESFRELCEDRLSNAPSQERINDWMELLAGRSRSHTFNWTRESARQFLECLILLVRDRYTVNFVDVEERQLPDERLSYRLIPDILQRLEELDRGGNPALVVNSLLEEIFYPEESREWASVI